METSIPAAVIAAVLMVSVMVLARSGYQSFDGLGQAWRAMEARSGAQARTELTITSATHNAGLVDVAIKNDGDTRLAEFDRMDVVVEYTDSTPTFIVAYIDYTDGPLSQNTWVVQSISNDAFEPGIVNPGETLNMRISLNPAPDAGTTNRVLIATDMGVTVSSTFTG
jgi:archaellum component FlaF (FlaF/FlaG flagellin family)